MSRALWRVTIVEGILACVALLVALAVLAIPQTSAQEPASNPTWTVVEPGSAPGPCWSPYAFLDDAYRQIIVLCGADGPIQAFSIGSDPGWTAPVDTSFRTRVGSGFSAVFVTTTRDVVLFGGQLRCIIDPFRKQVLSSAFCTPPGYTNQTWAVSLSNLPSWRGISSGGSGPRPRANAFGLWDAPNDRLVYLGGFGWQAGDATNEVWGLPTSGSPPWSQLPPAGTAPPFYSRTPVHDTVNRRVVLVEAGLSVTQTARTWSLNLQSTPEWAPLTISNTLPPGIAPGTPVYDSINQRAIYLTARYGYTPTVGLWTLTLSGVSTWSQLSPLGGGPAPDGITTGVFDAATQRVIVFTDAGEVWSLSLSGSPAWSLLSGKLVARPLGEDDVAIVDEPNRRLVVLADRSLASYPPTNTILTLPLAGPASWTTATVTGDLPPYRSKYTAVHDRTGSRMIVFGGQGDTSSVTDSGRNDTWSLSLGNPMAWTPVTPTGSLPPRRLSHSAVYDAPNRRMIVFGGASTTSGGFAPGALGDVWALALEASPEWRQLQPAGTARPLARWGHSAIFDSANQQIVVFGGYNPLTGHLNDVWAHSLSSTPTWTELRPSGPGPAGREEHSAIYDEAGHRMIIYGGYRTSAGYSVFQDAWALNLDGAPTWSQLTPGGSGPGARFRHAAAYDAETRRMLLFGGTFQSTCVFGPADALWSLSLTGNLDPQPSPITPRAAPPFMPGGAGLKYHWFLPIAGAFCGT